MDVMDNDNETNNDRLGSQSGVRHNEATMDIVDDTDEALKSSPSTSLPSLLSPENPDAISDYATDATYAKGNDSPPSTFLPSERTFVDGTYSSPPKSPKKRSRTMPHHRDNNWNQHLYSARAGTTTPIPKLIKRLENKGLATPSTVSELEKYGDYDLENFTFLQEILPNLFLGSVLALDPHALSEAGITRILTVMTSNPYKDEKAPNHENIAREYIMMKDVTSFQSHPWYQTTSAIIDSALHVGERILIHCRMGISRSATVVAAYLTFRHGLSPHQAIAWIKSQRPIIHPNSGFQEQLQDYYSVLQMDHGPDFGWINLSLCKDFELNTEREQIKKEKRRRAEIVRARWKQNKVEWCQCFVVNWGEDIERIVQRHITGNHSIA